MSETLYINNALLPNTIISMILPAFETQSVTAGVGRLRRADASSRSRVNPAFLDIDVGADHPAGPASVHCQVDVGARGVLQYLQTVSAINNVNPPSPESRPQGRLVSVHDLCL